MLKRMKAMALLLTVLLVAPLASLAQAMAYASKTLNLRAGPDRAYPVVAIVPAGVALSVSACLPDYRWCDVVAGASRGWVYAGNIVVPYQGANVPLLHFGATLGIAVVTFSLGNYWDDHYRLFPWYPQRQLWIERPLPPRLHHRPRPSPLHHAPPIRPEGPRSPGHGTGHGAHPMPRPSLVPRH